MLWELDCVLLWELDGVILWEFDGVLLNELDGVLLWEVDGVLLNEFDTVLLKEIVGVGLGVTGIHVPALQVSVLSIQQVQPTTQQQDVPVPHVVNKLAHVSPFTKFDKNNKRKNAGKMVLILKNLPSN